MKQAREFLENYFVLSLVLSLTIMVILWSKNPPFIQQETDSPELQGEPDLKKLILTGIAAFLFVIVGPFFSDFIFSPLLWTQFLS